MTNPTAIEVTLKYLFGSLSVPTNLLSQDLIRTDQPTDLPVDAVSYMATGAGRFAIGRQFELVNRFFTYDASMLPPGVYTKKQIADMVGLSDSYYGLNISQLTYQDAHDDYFERAYIYGSTPFIISEGSSFEIMGNGERKILNFRVEPADNFPAPGINDNFDTKSSNPIISAANLLFEPYVDPSKIGRVVSLNFEDIDLIPKVTYDGNSYYNDLLKMTNWSTDMQLFKLRSETNAFVDSLFNQGVTKFLTSDNKPILYASSNSGDSVSVAADLFFIKAPKLAPYAGNGAVLVGGSGKDTLSGGKNNDLVLGGSGNDKLSAGGGTDILTGGAGYDQFAATANTTITDLERQEGVRFEGTLLSQLVRADDDGNFIDGNGFQYVYSGGTLTVSRGGMSITIEGTTATSGDEVWRVGSIAGIAKDSESDDETPPDAFDPNNPGAGGLTNVSITGEFGDTSALAALALNPLNPPPSDPLVIDLNGDGFNLSSVANSTVYMDMAGDGYAEKMGWVKGTEGFLAIDRNGNGSIDTPSDLFGNATTDGFIALKALDSNNDNLISGADAQFANLRVWQDANEDGFAQTAEVKTFATLGISSISLVSTASGQMIAGNTVAATATVNMTDGAARTIGSVYFGTEPSLSEWVPPSGFTIDPTAAKLPNLKGYGFVKDLDAAMTLDAALKTLVLNLANNSETLTGQQIVSAVEEVVTKWAGAEGVTPGSRGAFVDATHLKVIEQIYGGTYVDTLNNGQTSANPNAINGPNLEVLYKTAIDTFMTEIFGQIPASKAALSGNFTDQTNSKFAPLALLSEGSSGAFDVAVSLVMGNAPTGDAAYKYYADMFTVMRGAAVHNFDGDYAAYKAAYGELTPTLHKYLDIVTDGGYPTFGDASANTIYGAAGNEALVGLAGDDLLVGRNGSDVLVGGTGNDVLDGTGGDDTYIFNLGDGQDTIREYTADMGSWGGFDTVQFGQGISLANLTVSQIVNGRDILLTINGTSDSVTLQYDLVSPVDQRIEQVRFADGTTLSHSQLLTMATTATSGADAFYGDEQANTLAGLGGNDLLVGRNGDDTITGGTGNDLLDGTGGNDTYAFNLGDGQDTISEYTYDMGSWGGFDTIQFGTGISLTNLVVSQSADGGNMILSVSGTSDQITIVRAFSSPVDNRVEQVRFADNSTISYSDLVNRLGSNASETIHGDELANNLSAKDGDDTVYGWNGDDTLNGGNGNDTLIGGAGADTYIGGSGTDTIDYSGESAGVRMNMQSSSQSVNGVTVAGGTAIVAGGLIETLSGIENVIGTQWNDSIFGSTIANLFTLGDGNDWISSGSGDDTILGGNGNDFINSHNGDDVVDGGAGVDTVTYSGSSATVLVNLSTTSQTLNGIGAAARCVSS